MYFHNSQIADSKNFTINAESLDPISNGQTQSAVIFRTLKDGKLWINNNIKQ